MSPCPPQEWATTLFVRPATIDGIGVPLDNDHQEDQQEGKEGGPVGASVGASAALPPSSDGVLLFLWDMFFTEGRTALFRIALMILQEAEEEILAANVGEEGGKRSGGRRRGGSEGRAFDRSVSML